MSNVIPLVTDTDELERLWLDFRAKRQASLATLSMDDMIQAGTAYGKLLAALADADPGTRNALRQRVG